MPKLDGTQLVERLQNRLENLKQGKEVAKRDIETLLTDKQIKAMNASWAQQQELRQQKRARSKEEEKELGWKTKRQVHIETFEAAVEEAHSKELTSWHQRVLDSNVRQARVYFDSLGKELKDGKDMQVATLKANNDLTRVGLRRLDDQTVGRLSKRDKEVWVLEADLLSKFVSEAASEVREQLDLLKLHEQMATKKGNKQKK